LRGLRDVQLDDVSVTHADTCQLQTLPVSRLQPVPNALQEILVVREYDYLRAGRPATLDLLDRAVLAKGVLAVERVVEHDDTPRFLVIVLQLGQEERER